MIVVLSLRFRKHIALFLYTVFYSQLLLASNAISSYGDHAGRPRPQYGIIPGRLFTGTQRTYASSLLPDMAMDSGVQPRYSAPYRNMQGSPSFRTPQLPEKHSLVGGPSQPESQSFQSVNNNNMVDLFSGDFSYNIPLLDVGGYPVNIAYQSGRSMDEDASWVGLGWNINPGSITRNMRGLPDDFSGGTDTVKKVSVVKPNISWGVSVGADFELAGVPLLSGVSGSVGVFHTTYTGWGLETSLNASLNAGSKALGPLSGGLSLTNNSQNGITITPGLSFQKQYNTATDNGSASVGIQFSSPYNSRMGLKDLHFGLTASAGKILNRQLKDGKYFSGVGWEPVGISFAWPSYTPTISMPMTNFNYTFTAKLGGEVDAAHPNLFLSGYYGKESVEGRDSSLSIPAYGYLNFHNRGSNWSALMDFNREKEMPYRESPPVPHIAIPAYTYDVFSISGEGTGGMFRAYRSDIGYIADHLISNKTNSGAASIDLGGGNIVHGGADLNANYSITQTGPWLNQNPLNKLIDFRSPDKLFEAAYFRNPGEKTINTTDFYNAIGGDKIVVPALTQNGSSIMTSSILNLWDSGKQVGTDTLNLSKTAKNTRDKRSQVISYLTAEEASVSGLDKYINRYSINEFGHSCDNDAPADGIGIGTGMQGYFFTNMELDGVPFRSPRLDTTLVLNWNLGNPFWNTGNKNGETQVQIDRNFPNDHFSARWIGRLKAPVTGGYGFSTFSDDGVRVWINDTLVINNWTYHSLTFDTCHLNLIAGKMYDVRIEFFEGGTRATMQFGWRRPDRPGEPFNKDHKDSVQIPNIYPPVFTDTVAVNQFLTKENRVNSFRKSNHISEIDVLNSDGRRYVYGIPVYNLLQKEVSFSVNKDEGNIPTGLAGYTDTENSTRNTSGKEGYYSREELPAYAHSFLLTGILSPDYVDVTGDGISDDDIGDAVRFNYTKTAGIANPFGWRAPYVKDSANYSEGFHSYDRDDKAHYIYGTKELWYLHTIESKTMIATFTLEPRKDLLEIDEHGNKTNTSKAMLLSRIDLYSKADFMQHGTAATPIKTVHFKYCYELARGINQPVNDSGKLTLKKIWFTYNGNDKGELNPYVFNYHSNNPRYKVNTADKWGTYKDPAQNPGFLNNSEYPYSLQDSALAASNVGAWNLDSIRLPSGGRIKVKYESDDYAYVQNRRATQMCRIAGIGTDSLGGYANRLYKFFQNDGLYVYLKVPYKPANRQDLYARYLEGITKLYFRLNVVMPKDDFGSGAEYVPCYADLDTGVPDWYGIKNDSTIWVKVKGVNKTGDGDGPYNPLAQTAINFLRLNLPSKAYPGSEVNDNVNFVDGIKIIMSQVTNAIELIGGFTNTARGNGWASIIDSSRSFARLNSPILKKYGGGLRVKSILIYDNWNAMTHKKETVYGQIYDYTTTQSVNGVMTKISSGVAAWEPSIGCEENPFHLPIEYVQRTSLLAPASLQYSEEPLGEEFFPGPTIGYRKVRVRSIHTISTRSANGYSESTFYTSYDFPTTWGYSLLDNNSKKRYKPLLNNFLRVDAKNYLTLSQGFKIELNDMNGKVHTEATYSETDSVNPISFTENFYKVDNQLVQFKHLNNTVTTIDPQGHINAVASIGKDIELMTDMRDQTSNSTGANINVNIDMFAAGPFPVIIPSLLNLYQHEVDQFRSVAMTKVIQRYGILDSVIHIDKGSKISSKNLLYDAETGEPLLVRTQNEFNDSLFQFTYPAHWVYPGVGPAYQNIDAQLSHLTVFKGKIKNTGITASDYLSGGDELYVTSKVTIIPACFPTLSVAESFPDQYKLWVIDTNKVSGGTPALFLVDQYGSPFSGNDVSLKVVRSGHRNQASPIGSVVSLANPVVSDGSGGYQLLFDSTRKVLNAGANELQQFWRVSDKRRSDVQTTCIYTPIDSTEARAEACSCLKPFFDYLIANHKLYPFGPFGFPRQTVRSIAAAAHIDLSSCPLLNANADGTFRVMTPDRNGNIYMAMLGNAIVDIRNISGAPMTLDSLSSSSCDAQGHVIFKNPNVTVPAPDTITLNIHPLSSVNLISSIGTSCPSYIDSLLQVDSTSDKLLIENSLSIDGVERNSVPILDFGRLDLQLPLASQNILSARLILTADQRGHIPTTFPNANSVNRVDSVGISLSSPAGWFPTQPLDSMLYQAYYTPWFAGVKNDTPFRSINLDVLDYLNGYLDGTYQSSVFVLSQGSGGMHSARFDSTMIAIQAVPPYLTSGYGNYYSTYYSQRYSDTSKWPTLQVKYVVYPSVDTMGAVLEYNSSATCSTVTGRSCYSAITDTLVNPYQYAILGNYRPQRTYVYYGRRKESDPNQAINIRTAGVINNFAPFWVLQSGHWGPSYDTTRWVWNSQTTLFNRKGFELENKDPLGRYNSGTYGYGLTLPTAVTQNSRFQEAAFDGFEDYGFKPSTCDTACAEARPFDFSAYQSNISDSMSHTGLYSLRIAAGSSISLIGLPVASTPDPETPQLTDSTATGTCESTFEGMKASSGSVLPPFKPFAGKRMLISAWVKEKDSCSCQTYSNNHILLNFTLSAGGPSAVSLLPAGNMIEGWQRYEAVVDIPSNATSMTLTLQASSSSVTYFDDIRIHPFNAEMKSYVYNPVNLRLMAQLDENNYATFYEYDDDGTLIRVKKETERGIQTIKETRNALLKDQ